MPISCRRRLTKQGVSIPIHMLLKA
jgi:hypothetical protein